MKSFVGGILLITLSGSSEVGNADMSWANLFNSQRALNGDADSFSCCRKEWISDATVTAS